MVKKQRKLFDTNATDRVVMTCSKEMGQRIRKLADKKGLTISHLLATIVEPKIVELETEQILEGKEN